MKDFSEQLLREAVKEADKKKEKGILIWLDRRFWDEARDALREGNEHYDFAISQVFKEKEGTITVNMFGFKTPAIYAVPVQKMKNSEEYFQMIIKACEYFNNVGPITFIPSNKVAECFE